MPEPSCPHWRLYIGKFDPCLLFMAPKTARHTILSEITPFDDKSGDFRIVIETPKGSRNKYSYDPDCDCLQLSTVLPEGFFRMISDLSPRPSATTAILWTF
jgi:hypothetical protein